VREGVKVRTAKTSRGATARGPARLSAQVHATRSRDNPAEHKRSPDFTKFEEMFQESERLAQIGRLSASIAHEIKNPLEAIEQVLYLLESNGANDEQRRYIATAQTEVKRAVDIANQTLDFARNASNPVPVKIRSILDDVLDFYGRKITYKQLSVEVRHNFDGEIKGSPGELRQIFSNLVVNSLEGLERGQGKLTLRSSRGHHWKNREQSGVRVVVSDNGPGIPAEQLKQIFEPFFSTKGGKGSGLGLWITRTLVQKYGGAIRLRSSVRAGRSGTCFSVFLPCA
jgi:two-component system, chemotaxis family, CheB/CheR fusion protein